MTNVNKFGLFFELLAKMPRASKDEIVMQYSGGTSLNELYERSPKDYKRMIKDMKQITGSNDVDDVDKWRKRVIAAVGGYFERAGLYAEKGKRERLQKIIGTACRAAGVKELNKMTETQMKRVYAEFVRKQKVTHVVEEVTEEAYEERGKRVIRKGCMSLVIDK